MATWGGYGWDNTYIADTDLSAKQYYFVTAASTEGYCKVSATAGGSILGVLQNDPKTGEEATVRVLGFSKVIANANASVLTYGGYIYSGSDGMAYGNIIGASGTWRAGRAEEALSTGSGIEVRMYVNPFYW